MSIFVNVEILSIYHVSLFDKSIEGIIIVQLKNKYTDFILF